MPDCFGKPMGRRYQSKAILREAAARHGIGIKIILSRAMHPLAGTTCLATVKLAEPGRRLLGFAARFIQAIARSMGPATISGGIMFTEPTAVAPHCNPIVVHGATNHVVVVVVPLESRL